MASPNPTQSILPLQCLLGLIEQENLHLIQEFVCYNPARLPSPVEWVNKQRIRVKDSFTKIWWLSKTIHPKANNANILCPYSKSMQNLLRKQSYNSGKRPSGHNIGVNSFKTDNHGSIPSNVISLEKYSDGKEERLPYNVLKIANTNSNDQFSKICKEKNITLHPARMPEKLAAYFISFLTDEGDLVVDPFAGSNTTGYVAELMNRQWISIEISEEYKEQADIRHQILKDKAK